MSYLLYDIRTKELAQETLVRLTGVSLGIWQQYNGHELRYEYSDKLVQKVIKEHGRFPNNYRIFEFLFTHITTSGNGCASIQKNGLLNTRQAYLCTDSELRKFLDEHGIQISLRNQVLKYNGKQFDISVNEIRDRDIDDYRLGLGLKLYDDYAVNGFLSIDINKAYGGRIHIRPEILLNIDQLLNLDLSKDWEVSHVPFQITARVSGKDIVCPFDKHLSDREKTFRYIMYAYENAFGFPSQIVCRLKKSKMVPSERIQISPLVCWKENAQNK